MTLRKKLYYSFVVLIILPALTGYFTSCVFFKADPWDDQFSYEDMSVWLAHPDKQDPSDFSLPAYGIEDRQADAKVDVFYLHSTTLFSDLGASDIEGEKTDSDLKSEMKFHGVAFNGDAKIYAPFYRQASAYELTQGAEGERYYDLAYSDVRDAFEHYLASFNKERPIIIAGHGQGSLHAARLIKEFFDGKPLASRLVAAYLPGAFVGADTFNHIPLLSSAEETGGFVSWVTIADKELSKLTCGFNEYRSCATFTNLTDKPVCVNPINWSAENGLQAKKEENLGSAPDTGLIASELERIDVGLLGAVCNEGILNISMDELGESSYNYLSMDGDFHESDYELFIMSIRKNVADRVKAFLASH